MTLRIRLSHHGLSLVELLVATVVAGTALAGAWAWLWTVAPPARSLQARAECSTSAAFALREVVRDLQECSCLLTPTACPSNRGLLIEHRHPATALETIPVVWDPARQVLWRKTSSTYLADHVTRFAVTYLSESGDPIEPGVAGGKIAYVARVHLELTVSTAHRSESAEADVAVRL